MLWLIDDLHHVLENELVFRDLRDYNFHGAVDWLRSTHLLKNSACLALVKLSSLSQPLFRWRPYDEKGSGVAFTILYRFLEGLLCHKTVYGTSTKRKEDGPIVELQIIVSGFEIPSWLNHQSVRNSISIELPSNWCNCKWMGFALCASVSGPKTKSICLFYLSCDDWFATIGNGECGQIKVIFATNDSAIHACECGVSLVYEQDVDEFSQTNAQCLIESFGKEFIVGIDDDDNVHRVDDGDDEGLKSLNPRRKSHRLLIYQTVLQYLSPKR
ncbi:hypothetical protein CMV_012068 [Castanea mollissima]|uniref:C-JID domain-containing protein n=1 Tax=Castanea mollissima TaxID=60419 RepID=A0A8J4R0R9_9ROSI|nr:hypothetical protein CMV_012068 [Castanea mollissima]